MIFSKWRNLPELCTQTFTYFIPAPPPRKTGYREREFDTLFSLIASLGGVNFHLTTQSVSGAGQGMWVIVYYQCAPTQRPHIEQALEQELGSLFIEESGP